MLILNGFDTVKVGEKIELPNMPEMLKSFPFCKQCDLWDLYKYGNVDLINILDKLELTNKYRYVSVNIGIQFLSPRTTPSPRGNWHFDGNGFAEENDSKIHLLLSDSTSLTEFMTKDLVLEQFSERSRMAEVEVYLNQHPELFEAVSIEPGRFNTFSGVRHFHRAVRPKQNEFRFALRVMESNFVEPQRLSQAIEDVSEVYDDGITDPSQITVDYIINNITTSHTSIVRHENSCTVYAN